jgi:NAD(P)-dependent dehydrogenase (short-subunit alcohol dehydrogenase family)
MELQGKTAIISGGGSGIGKASAFALLKEGVNVVISSNVKDDLERTKNEAEKLNYPGGLNIFYADVTNPEESKGFVNYSYEKFGGIDILINNAGIFFQKPPEQISLDDWDRSFDINVRAHFILDQLILPIMKKKKNGYIVNLSSSIFFAGGYDESDRFPYYASKMAVVGLARGILQDAKANGIKVSTIYPDRVLTNMAKNIHWDGVINEEAQWLLPEDVASAIIFLLKTNDRCFIPDLYLRNWIN